MRISKIKEILKRVQNDITPTGWLLMLAGTLTWSLTMVKSGLGYSFGLGFWGPNGHDGVWHIALIESLVRGSWRMPIFAGETIRNYHVGFDLLLVIIHKITLIPVSILYFQIIPVVMAFFIGVFVYKFVYSWKKSKLSAFWATFFVYFGGSFGWIVTFFRNGEVSGESLFWSQQSMSSLVNPPFALSLLIIFAALNLLSKGLPKYNKKQLIIAVFLFGLLVQIKVYAGILCLGGLFVAGLWRMVRRKGISLMRVFAGSLIISILFFSPMTQNVNKTIVYRPFWFLETMMQLSDRFDWPRYAEAMINYRLGNIWIKAIPAYLGAFAIFLLGNIGTRIFASIWFIKKLKLGVKGFGYIDVFLVSVIVAGIVLSMFFLQAGTPWNTIQFFYYSLTFLGVLAGVAVGGILGRHSSPIVQYTVSMLIVLLAIPSAIATLRHYLPSRPPAMLSKEEVEALRVLSDQPDGVVLTYPFDREAAEAAVNNPPRPLYLYESTAYVSAFSRKPVYLEDEVNLDITGYDWRFRRGIVLEFLDTLDHQKAYDFLRENNIEYVYWLKGQRAKLGEAQLGIEKIFENSKVDVYKVI